MNKIILIIIVCIIIFFIIENYCRHQNKTLLEVIKPNWFNTTSFPYKDFPCKINCNNYYNVINKGYNIMKNKKVVLSGLCINIEKKIDKLKIKLEQLGNLFLDYKIVIFENDSNDNTRKLLLDWSEENNNVHIIRCVENEYCILKNDTAITHGTFSELRMKKMINYRNRIIDYINNNFMNYDCVCSIDIDFNGPINLNGVAHSFSVYDTWDSISANGLTGITLSLGQPVYHDFIAFEKNNIDIEKNIIDIYNVFRETRKDIGSDLIPVKSAFGGFAIYKMYIYNSGINYTPYDNIYKCEHKIFHDNMRNNGYNRIFINPNMIILMGLQGEYKKYPLH
jgi:hypothetical protein